MSTQPSIDGYGKSNLPLASWEADKRRGKRGGEGKKGGKEKERKEEGSVRDEGCKELKVCDIPVR